MVKCKVERAVGSWRKRSQPICVAESQQGFSGEVLEPIFDVG